MQQPFLTFILECARAKAFSMPSQACTRWTFRPSRLLKRLAIEDAFIVVCAVEGAQKHRIRTLLVRHSCEAHRLL